MKEVEKTTGPFRYDLNQIRYTYTVEVTNRFKGLDLADRVPRKLWMAVHNIVQESVTKTIPKENLYYLILRFIKKIYLIKIMQYELKKIHIEK